MVERRDLPLFAWGDALRAARNRRRRLRRRGLVVAAGSAALLATIALPPAPLLLWNASASAPVGLYRIVPHAPSRRGDMVVARLPAALRSLAAQRLYLPVGVPLVKRVAAVAGDMVRASGAVVRIDGHMVARRRPRDRLGRPLPWWSGCHRLGPGAVFLLMADRADSFDGRYFGVTVAPDIVGRAVPLWVR